MVRPAPSFYTAPEI